MPGHLKAVELKCGIKGEWEWEWEWGGCGCTRMISFLCLVNFGFLRTARKAGLKFTGHANNDSHR